MGATHNLDLLENVLMKIEHIPFYQYTNYLSQITFCVELGLKSIIHNADDFEHIHELEKLFIKLPEPFQKKFKLLYEDEEIFNTYMEKTERMFEDCRYMNTEGIIKEFLDVSIVNSNGTINLKMAIELESFRFLRIFLAEIFEYEKFMWKEALKQITNIDNSSIDNFINQYTESLKNIQSNIILTEKL